VIRLARASTYLDRVKIIVDGHVVRSIYTADSSAPGIATHRRWDSLFHSPDDLNLNTRRHGRGTRRYENVRSKTDPVRRGLSRSSSTRARARVSVENRERRTFQICRGKRIHTVTWPTNRNRNETEPRRHEGGVLVVCTVRFPFAP